jgi:hypothetical protein
VLLWPVNGHIEYVSRILFKRIFWRDGRICSTRIDYMRGTEGCQGKNKKRLKIVITGAKAREILVAGRWWLGIFRHKAFMG